MDCINYLKNSQGTVYKLFENSLNKDKLFHAYLLSGQTGTPLLEVAKFFAKSMLCENPNPFADNSCITCHRIDEGIYSDFIVIDGKENEIKKEDIIRIEHEFSKTSQENNGKKIYIIHLIENMKDDCVNALLKFLEEPTEDTYAILTTENEFRILPTILSRTEIIHFNLLDHKDLINESIELGVKQDDAQMLCNFYNDSEAIKEHCDDDYISIKELTLKLFDSIDNKNNIRLYIEDQILPKIKSKEDARFFLDILIFLFKEANLFKYENNTIYSSYVNIFKVIISNINKIDVAVITLMDARNELNFNINIDLLILHTLTKIIGE